MHFISCIDRKDIIAHNMKRKPKYCDGTDTFITAMGPWLSGVGLAGPWQLIVLQQIIIKGAASRSLSWTPLVGYNWCQTIQGSVVQALHCLLITDSPSVACGGNQVTCGCCEGVSHWVTLSWKNKVNLYVEKLYIYTYQVFYAAPLKTKSWCWMWKKKVIPAGQRL